jgi:hypothetical protein
MFALLLSLFVRHDTTPFTKLTEIFGGFYLRRSLNPRGVKSKDEG